MFYELFKFCISEHVAIDKSLIAEFKTTTLDERKYLLPLKNGNGECFWLTIGIGNDTSVESEVKKTYPQCKIFGIEGIVEQVGDFEKYGTAIISPVGVKEGILPLTVREKGIYVRKNLTIKPIDEILENYLKTSLIHYVTLDIEGSEYQIIEALMTGNLLDNKGIAFCQIDVEFHNPTWFHNQLVGKDFSRVKFIKRFVANASYIPISIVPYTGHIHFKITFINVVSSGCEDAFNFHRYFR